MNTAAADRIAKAVLYEGYMLYPYRPSAVKNQQRFNFGVLYPQAFSEAAERGPIRGLCSRVPGAGSSVSRDWKCASASFNWWNVLWNEVAGWGPSGDESTAHFVPSRV